ncbi:hypothetical protein [Lysinibacter sp. HNR]|uniref:hypothetical protein n=1 Tax=Lysinibacter sp. HNR TaxID=3031408 RepID=UPI002435EE29|nr:hypothetical protein [Lysinibacter sp. HNR]WGD37308.1 hypothetical protein FrondiHNR_12915 [Lysinibacter sp. HNR]
MSSVVSETKTGGGVSDSVVVRLVGAVRSAGYLSAAVILAFTPHLHDSLFAHVFLGLFGVIFAVAFFVVGHRVWGSRFRFAVMMHATVSALVGIVSFVTLLSGPVVFVVLLAVWALMTAASDVWLGYAVGERRFGIDLYISAAFAVIFACAMVIPGAQPTPLLGIFGGYLAIAGVYLGIAAASVNVVPRTRRGFESSSPRVQSSDSQTPEIQL